MNTEPRFKGRVALVLGGSRGIGEAIVRRLAAEGASIALTYLSSPEKAAEVAHAAEAEGGPAMAIKADSADTDAVKAAVDERLASSQARVTRSMAATSHDLAIALAVLSSRHPAVERPGQQRRR
jgi:NAD(P)-dependent dehydrogenase (short-subunit alcohol dehydrogenase family)